MTADSGRINDAVAAFDAGNLAWGHFRHEVLPAYSAAQTEAVERIREALGDAAIAAAELRAGGPPAEFRAALAGALTAVDDYRLALPEEAPRDDLDGAYELLSEALALFDRE